MAHPSPSAARDHGLDVVVLATGPSPLARLEGDLDAASAPTLIDAIQPVIGPSTASVVLDCGALRFCDSSGLRALVTLHKMLPEGATVSLVRTSDLLRQVLRVTALDSVFEVA